MIILLYWFSKCSQRWIILLSVTFFLFVERERGGLQFCLNIVSDLAAQELYSRTNSWRSDRYNFQGGGDSSLSYQQHCRFLNVLTNGCTSILHPCLVSFELMLVNYSDLMLSSMVYPIKIYRAISGCCITVVMPVWYCEWSCSASAMTYNQRPHTKAKVNSMFYSFH